MLIHRIKLTNLLSFGPDSAELELRPLNVLIGPNGSGKSNFIDVFGLLKSTPGKLEEAILAEGGISDWLWRREQKPAINGEVEAVLEGHRGKGQLRYSLTVAQVRQALFVTEEKLEEVKSNPKAKPTQYFSYDGFVIDVKNPKHREVGTPEIDFLIGQSALSQLKDPMNYPQITYVGRTFERMQLYRDWSFGRSAPMRLPQKPDMPNSYLTEDAANLGLVLSRLSMQRRVKRKILDALQDLYAGITDFHVHTEYGTVQVFVSEGDTTFSAARLSDGAMRYLATLAILCDPSPPPLVCLEEPELGLHPDILPGLADLLRDASERCQLIVTTHSDVLVDKLTDTPESIVVCEKHQGQTQLRRLQKDELAHWLEDYSLGTLWTKGELGGTRW